MHRGLKIILAYIAAIGFSVLCVVGCVWVGLGPVVGLVTLPFMLLVWLTARVCEEDAHSAQRRIFRLTTYILFFFFFDDISRPSQF